MDRCATKPSASRCSRRSNTSNPETSAFTKRFRLAKKQRMVQKDMRMTGYALGLHEELKQKGVVGDSEEYYKEIDEEMRKSISRKV